MRAIAIIRFEGRGAVDDALKGFIFRVGVSDNHRYALILIAELCTTRFGYHSPTSARPSFEVFAPEL